MTEKSIVTTSKATDLLAADADNELRAMTAKLIRLTPGGRKLTTENAANLAVYCYMTQLNPFNGEAYWVDGAGPIPGVAGVRRKANEYLQLTSTPTDRFFVEFRDAQPGEASFDPDAGDIAKHATLKIRSISEHWQQNIMKLTAELTKAGVDIGVAWDRAVKLAGAEPVWTACGVVDHRESFSRAAGTKGKNDPGTPDKWDRHQRAEKRAEKWAIRKAFPSVLLPDAELGEAAYIDAEIVDAIVRDVTAELANPPEPRAEGEILAELGYTVKPGVTVVPEPVTIGLETPSKPTVTEHPPGEPVLVGLDTPSIALEPEGEPVPDGNGPEHATPAASWDPDFVKVLLQEQVAQHPKHAVMILNLLQPTSADEAALLGKMYRGHRDKDVEQDKAVELTLQGVAP
jgi:hypothetical protein